MDWMAPALEKYLEACTYQKNLNAKTVKAYRIDLRQFLEYLTAKGSGFDKETVKNYIACLNQHFKPRTAKRKRTLLPSCGSSCRSRLSCRGLSLSGSLNRCWQQSTKRSRTAVPRRNTK